MRWFIEVSTVGSGETDTEYCVEAKQWQAALQAARKLRGEAGPLSAFSIELLDSGYRAIDKKQNLKYVVKKAPNDAPLNDGKNGSASAAAEAKVGEVESVTADTPPEASEKSAPGHQVASSPRASGPPPRPRLVSSRPPPGDASDKSAAKSKSSVAKMSGAPLKKGPQKVAELLAAAALKAGKATSTQPTRVTGAVGTQPAARAVTAVASANATALARGPEREQESAKVEAPNQDVATDAAVDKDPIRAVESSNDQDVASSPLPEFEVIRTREEEPSAETPITYREVALAVNPGATRRSTESLLWARFRSIQTELSERPKGKFVQLAVFDHVFAKKPMRPPVATLLWKDWRGEPVLAFPGFTGDSIQPEALPEEEPAAGSLRPTSVIPVDETTGSRPPPPRELDTSSEAPTDGETTSSPQAQKSAGAAAGADTAAEQASAGDASNGAAATTQLEASGSGVGGAEGGTGVATAGAEAPVLLQRRKTKSERPAPAHETSGSASKQRDPVSEDLIGDLFEKMHELHFMADVVAGAEYVLSVVKQTLPGAFALVHVFDINTKNFVLVRQYGASEKALLFQTPDSDPHLRSVMRSARTMNLDSSNIDSALEAGRFKAGGVEPQTLLCGPVKLGGRYLGLIEIGNGSGAKPFADVEANALDYICEQFAQFLTNRPIVLDADLILK